MKHGSNWRWLVWAAACSLGTALAAGQGDGNEGSGNESALRLHGFGTVGVTHSSSNFGGRFRRDIGQAYPAGEDNLRTDSRLGLQANYALSPQWELVGQILMQDKPSSKRAVDRVEWGFVAYRPTPDTTIRLGRTNMDVYLMSDYRNVGFAYTMARPALDFYGVLPLQSLDGLDISKTWTIDDVQWRIKAFAGKATQHIVDQQVGVLGIKMRSRGLVVSRDSDGLLMRATWSYGKITSEGSVPAELTNGLNALSGLPVPSVASEASALNDQVSASAKPTGYMALGMSYDRNRWLLNAEAAHISSPLKTLASNSAYAMLGRRWQSLTGFVGVGVMHPLAPKNPTPDWVTPLAPLGLGASAVQNAQMLGIVAAQLANTMRLDQRSVSLGVRWDFHPRMALKVQWDRIMAKPDGNGMTGGNLGGGRVDAVSALVDFMF